MRNRRVHVLWRVSRSTRRHDSRVHPGPEVTSDDDAIRRAAENVVTAVTRRVCGCARAHRCETWREKARQNNSNNNMNTAATSSRRLIVCNRRTTVFIIIFVLLYPVRARSSLNASDHRIRRDFFLLSPPRRWYACAHTHLLLPGVISSAVLLSLSLRPLLLLLSLLLLWLLCVVLFFPSPPPPTTTTTRSISAVRLRV